VLETTVGFVWHAILSLSSEIGKSGRGKNWQKYSQKSTEEESQCVLFHIALDTPCPWTPCTPLVRHPVPVMIYIIKFFGQS
jgi:hypothetical protein